MAKGRGSAENPIEIDAAGERAAIAAKEAGEDETGGDRRASTPGQSCSGAADEEYDWSDWSDLESEYLEDNYLPDLAPWPHGRFVDCVCGYSEYADLPTEDFIQKFRGHCEMTEDELMEYHEHLWEHQDELKKDDWLDVESSYTGRMRTSSTALAGIDYDRITPKELKTFISDRGLKDPYPLGITFKYFYIRALERADRQWTFPFMALPPEMRTAVYELLLTFPDGTASRKCSPAILRTCHAIHREAGDILYNANTIVVAFEVDQLNYGRHTKRATVHNRRETIQCVHGPFYCLPRGIDDYPAFLRHIRHLEIRVTYKVPGTIQLIEDGGAPVNHFLYTLSSFLAEGHQLKHLNIKADFPKDEDDRHIRKYLYPLRRLRNVPKVKITGNVPARTANKITKDVQSHEPVFNTLRHWHLLEQEAKTQIKLLEYLSCDVGRQCGECPDPERATEIVARMSSLHDAQRTSCFSSAHEEAFLACLALFKDTLEKTNLTKARRLLNDVAERRKQCRKHEAELDSGRMEEALENWDGDFYDEDAMHEVSDHDWSEDGATQTEEED